MSCPQDHALSAYADQEMRPAEYAKLARHVQGCPVCQRRLAQFEGCDRPCASAISRLGFDLSARLKGPPATGAPEPRARPRFWTGWVPAGAGHRPGAGIGRGLGSLLVGQGAALPVQAWCVGLTWCRPVGCAQPPDLSFIERRAMNRSTMWPGLLAPVFGAEPRHHRGRSRPAGQTGAERCRHAVERGRLPGPGPTAAQTLAAAGTSVPARPRSQLNDIRRHRESLVRHIFAGHRSVRPSTPSRPRSPRCRQRSSNG